MNAQDQPPAAKGAQQQQQQQRASLQKFRTFLDRYQGVTKYKHIKSSILNKKPRFFLF